MPADDEEEEDLDYGFNDKSKLTPEKQKELNCKVQDQAVPIGFENEESYQENNPPEEVEEANPKENFKKELQKSQTIK